MQNELMIDNARELVRNEILGNRYSKSYKKELEKNIETFISWCNKNLIKDFSKINRNDLQKYHRYIEQTKSKKTGELLSSSTVNNRYYAVFLLFRLLYQAGIIEENPAQYLDLNLKTNKIWKRRPLSIDEINYFLEHIDIRTKQGLKDRTIFELMYSSGLRVCEIVNLQIGDINFNQREMIVRGKFGTDRIVPISIVARDFLYLYLGNRIEELEEPVFISYSGINTGHKMKAESVSERFHDLLKRFDMYRTELSAHSIRHSTATHLLDNGASIRHVQELLGHKDIGTTERYTHVQTEGVAKMFRKFHPREHDLFESVDEEYIRHLDYFIKQYKNN